MNKILIITVGGSYKPIISSINDNEPDFIYFLCSDDTGTSKGSYNQVCGKGKPCIPNLNDKDKTPRPSIVKQLRLENSKYDVKRIKGFDNLNQMYEECYKLIRECQTRFPESEIILDYTGGTKTMSAGLVAAGLEIGSVIFCVMRGTRADLKQVRDGTEKKWLIRNTKAYIEKQFNMSKNFAEKYEFRSAIKILEDLTDLQDLENAFHSQIIKSLDIIKAIEAWDNFDHQMALNNLEPYRKDFYTHLEYLKKIIDEINFVNGDEMEEGKGTGSKKVEYVMPWDIFSNAMRRALTGHFDDAVGRLYRCLELIVQLRLKEKASIETARVSYKILEQCSGGYFKDYYKIELDPSIQEYEVPLRASYGLLGELYPKDAIYGYYRGKESQILNLLGKRNGSILAHGFTPVTHEEYKEFEGMIGELLRLIIDIQNGFLKRYVKTYPAITFSDILSGIWDEN